MFTAIRNNWYCFETIRRISKIEKFIKSIKVSVSYYILLL